MPSVRDKAASMMRVYLYGPQSGTQYDDLLAWSTADGQPVIGRPQEIANAQAKVVAQGGAGAAALVLNALTPNKLTKWVFVRLRSFIVDSSTGEKVLRKRGRVAPALQTEIQRARAQATAARSASSRRRGGGTGAGGSLAELREARAEIDRLEAELAGRVVAHNKVLDDFKEALHDFKKAKRVLQAQRVSSTLQVVSSK